VAAMPIVINNMFIFLIQWVALAAFLRFGLFVEIIFAQIAVLVLLLKLRILRKGELFRLPLNLNMFFLVSLTSGLVYHGLGGEVGQNFTENSNYLWLAMLYAVVSYAMNQIIVSFNLYFIYKSKESYFGKDFIVETITTSSPFRLGLYCISFIIKSAV